MRPSDSGPIRQRDAKRNDDGEHPVFGRRHRVQAAPPSRGETRRRRPKTADIKGKKVCPEGPGRRRPPLGPRAVVTVFDDVYGNLFTGVPGDVPSFGYLVVLIRRELKTIPIREVVGVSIVLKPAVFHFIAGSVGHRAVTERPIILLMLVHFIAEEADVNFVAIALGHPGMIPRQGPSAVVLPPCVPTARD